MLPTLRGAGFDPTVLTPADNAIGRMVGYLTTLAAARHAECVLIQKRLLPRVVLWSVRRIARRLVFDFDDAIFVEQSSPGTPARNLARVVEIAAAADHVIAGNTYLKQWAGKYSESCTVIPTGVDTASWNATVRQEHEGIVLGWIGTSTNLKYIYDLLPHVSRLVRRFPQTRLRIVTDDLPEGLPEFVEFRKWSLEGELAAVAEFDVGLMPLRDDAWTRGKCGFKALQMMALGIPVVMSPVGVNAELVQPIGPGLSASEPHEWVDALSGLLSSSELRRSIGSRSRAFVAARFDVSMSAAALVETLQRVILDGD